MNELIEVGYKDIKISETREGNIEQSLLAREHFQHYMAVADFLSKSSMVPKGMQGKPADILIAMEMGLQIGIPMMQAIQDIAVINGKPSMYGDGLLAVVQGHKDYEWMNEEILRDKDTGVVAARCVIKRKNHEERSVLFTVDDAKKAQLWGKPGPWSQYPERMLQMRARGFCIRDLFSDALRGIKTEEETSDYAVPEQKTASNALKNLLNKKKDAVHSTEIVLASQAMVDSIIRLVQEVNFSPERFTKALEYYGVNDVHCLTEVHAVDFIKVLQKWKKKEVNNDVEQS